MSQKSSERKLSAQIAELMWLSYNCDILRFTVEQQPLVIDYDQWFSDCSGTTRRLMSVLGIDEAHSAEGTVEAAASIVHGDFRHHVAGKKDSAASFAVSMKLYAAMAARDGQECSLDGQVAEVEAFLNALAPLAAEFDVAAEARARVEVGERQIAEARELTTAKDSRIAALEHERKTAISDLKAAQRSLVAERDWLSRRLTPIEKRVIGIAKDLERNSALEAQLVEADRARKMLERQLLRQQIRTRLILRSAKAWRDEARSAAELHRLLTMSEARLVTAEERNRRFVTELEARDIATACRTERMEASETLMCFTWPADTGEAYDLIGGIEGDERGIIGTIALAGRPDIVPIIEARVDGTLVHAQSCAADDAFARPEGWSFTIPWSRFAKDYAGREAVICVAGPGHELGRTLIPKDLARYHLPPAVLAAELLGGTTSDAAEYHRWIAEHERPDELEGARAWRDGDQTVWPGVTVIVFGKELRAFATTIQSLRDQIHGQWEAICLDAPAELTDADPRVRVIAAADLNEVLAAYHDDALFSFVEAGDTIAPTALLHLANAALAAPDFTLVYSDEDLFNQRFAVRGVPYMKGAWSPDLALAQDYFTRLALLRRRSLPNLRRVDATAVYETCLRAAFDGRGPVLHLPFVLYHRSSDHLRPSEELAAAVEAVLADTQTNLAGAALERTESGWRIDWAIPKAAPLVSLIVPTRDSVELLRVCIDGFLRESRYDNLEVLIADNDSQREETKTYFAQVVTDPRVRVIECPGPFNFSAINNLAASCAKGALIGLMNNDLKVIDPEWLRHMVALAIRPDVGIVGAKLLHADDTIQHAGVTLGIGVASHLYKGFPAGAEGRQGRLILPQDLSAVTAACLLMRRDVWDEVGGLDEDFPVAYNDVDLCLKVTGAGYRVLWTPEAVLYHLESQSRGKDKEGDQRERLERDKARLTARWGERLLSDPFHSPNLSNTHVDARLAFPSRAVAPWGAAAA